MSALNRIERVALAITTALTVAAAIAHYARLGAVAAFVLSGLALAGLAWAVGLGTEEVGDRMASGAAGMLHATLGNLPELFVVIFALNSAQVVVAQTALLGSVFATALFVLGLTIVAGARAAPDGVMRFHPRLPRDTATLLLLSSFIIVLVALVFSSDATAARHAQTISCVGAALILLVYVSWAVSYARFDAGAEQRGTPSLTMRAALVLLALAAVAAGFAADWFVDALQPAIRSLGLTPTFAGLVVVALASNAVENVVGVGLAWRGRSELAISVVKNSVVQLAAFLLPLLVLVSALFEHSVTFAFPPVFTAALALTTIAVWQVTGDGEAAAFEGWALLATYVIIAAIAFYT
jgi:Ca2+:H+ antiporter